MNVGFWQGLKTLRRVVDQLSARGLDFRIAGIRHAVRAALQRSGVIAKLGPDRVYIDVAAAVDDALAEVARRHDAHDAFPDLAPLPPSRRSKANSLMRSGRSSRNEVTVAPVEVRRTRTRTQQLPP